MHFLLPHLNHYYYTHTHTKYFTVVCLYLKVQSLLFYYLLRRGQSKRSSIKIYTVLIKSVLRFACSTISQFTISYVLLSNIFSRPYSQTADQPTDSKSVCSVSYALKQGTYPAAANVIPLC